MSSPRRDRLLTPVEAAERLEVSRATVYAWIAQGRLRAVRPPDRERPIRIRESAVDALLDGWIDVVPTNP